MKLSIVVPVYNAEEYLQECIQSVINQTNFNWELVLVNDGSTDKSREICDAFAEKYPGKIFAFHKENEGQFLTRQYGITKCSGEYIGFLDADDLLHKAYVETILACVKDDCAIDSICFNFSEFEGANFKETKNLTHNQFKTEKELENLYLQIVNGNLTGSMCFKVFKKDLLNNTVFDETVVSQKNYGEDAYQSFTILLKAQNVCFLDDILYLYRSNSQGASRGFGERDFEYFNTIYVFELLESFLLQKFPESNHLLKRLYARNFNETVYYILKFYRSAKNKTRKKQVVQYDWRTFLLKEALNCIEGNDYVRKSYIGVWEAFAKKAYLEIFLREKFKKIIGW